MATTSSAPGRRRAAIRTFKADGRAHLWTGQSTGPVYTTVCGRRLAAPQQLPWESTAPEDRCRRCGSAPDDQGATFEPVPTPATR